MMAKKYMSIINKGGNDLYIKDAEAFQAINAIKYRDVYVGVGSTAQDAMIAANHHDEVMRGDQISITASSNTYVWVILPESYSPKVQMGGLNMPMTAKTPVTSGGVTYKVLRSDNQYKGTFDISLM